MSKMISNAIKYKLNVQADLIPRVFSLLPQLCLAMGGHAGVKRPPWISMLHISDYRMGRAYDSIYNLILIYPHHLLDS